MAISTTLQEKLVLGLECAERVAAEAAAARRSWALFEGLNGVTDEDREEFRVAINSLGLAMTAQSLAMALARDTILALFRMSGPPSKDLQTLCRMSKLLRDRDVVSALVAKAATWTQHLDYPLTKEDQATCKDAITFVSALVPPKWEDVPPPDPRLWELRSKLRELRDKILAHSGPTESVVEVSRIEIRTFLDLCSEAAAKAHLAFVGSEIPWEHDFTGRLREATEFWDRCQFGWPT